MVKKRKRVTKKTCSGWSKAIKIVLLLVVLTLAVVYVPKLVQSREGVQDGNETEGEDMMSNMVIFKTNKGVIKVELALDQAPKTSANFIELTRQGFYNGLTFHRYEPGFVIQGGDPKGDGTGGSDNNIDLEIAPQLKHDAGVIAMARANDPNSASSQFYFTLAPAHFLDGNYAIFGRVVEGMDVVLELRAGDVMEEVTLEE